MGQQQSAQGYTPPTAENMVAVTPLPPPPPPFSSRSSSNHSAMDSLHSKEPTHDRTMGNSLIADMLWNWGTNRSPDPSVSAVSSIQPSPSASVHSGNYFPPANNQQDSSVHSGTLREWITLTLPVMPPRATPTTTPLASPRPTPSASPRATPNSSMHGATLFANVLPRKPSSTSSSTVPTPNQSVRHRSKPLLPLPPPLSPRWCPRPPLLSPRALTRRRCSARAFGRSVRHLCTAGAPFAVSALRRPRRQRRRRRRRARTLCTATPSS